jgi:hypothetical protein
MLEDDNRKFREMIREEAQDILNRIYKNKQLEIIDMNKLRYEIELLLTQIKALEEVVNVQKNYR